MSRFARVVVPGCPHHVTQRGNHQQTVFRLPDHYRMYLDLLHQYSEKHRFDLLGYCLMPNHVHLIAVPGAGDSLAKGLGRTHNDYARWLQTIEGRSGHLWQNRFYSCPMDEAHCWRALRYVELNPVRAALVERAEHYSWSSARAHVTGTDDRGLLEWGAWRDRFEPRAWRESLQSTMEDAALAERMREATKVGRPLGAAEFVEELEQRLGRVLRKRKPGPPPRKHVAQQTLSLGVT